MSLLIDNSAFWLRVDCGGRIELPLGSVIDMDTNTYMCVADEGGPYPVGDNRSCDMCALECRKHVCRVMECRGDFRRDDTAVHFVEVELKVIKHCNYETDRIY